MTPTEPGAFNTANNRLFASGYDNVGNQTSDAQGRTFEYDGENRQTKFNVTAGQYFYDGDGHRVKKIDTTGITVFVYNAGGQLIAEYHSDPVPQPAGGGGTSYLTTDHLGSTRVVTKSDGTVKARYDYLPFGEELSAPIGGRTVGMGYSAADSTQQKFTQKERDTESGLDYFLARYYSSAQGRFTSTDPEIIPQDISNSQAWNKYPYSYNNPLRYVDPDGQAPQDSFDNRINHRIQQQLRGEITEQQYWEALRGESVGAIAGLAIVGAVALGVRSPQMILAIISWATRNPDKAQQVVQDLVQVSSGSPAPGPAGTLTISTGTRLAATEISTGARLAKQTGTALVESKHIGAEFVSAAGKTIDAMGGAAAYKHFGNGADFFKSITRHVNKSVDQVAIDLKGASGAQIKAVKGFVGGLTKKQQEKIIYVTE